MENESRYIPTYRAAEAQQVMAWVKSGQSGHILGLKGAGKSNFIRFLFDKAFPREHYLGVEHARFVFVLVNLLDLGEPTEWAIYEAMLNALQNALDRLNLVQETTQEIARIHESVLSNPSGLLAQRALQRAVGLAGQLNRLVFFLDEFDKAFQELPAPAFRGLRAIRDAYKEKVSYIVMGTHNLADLRSDLVNDVEHFYRLVGRNVCGLGPYTDEDARHMLHQMAAKREIFLDERIVTRLIILSGGHAGLLKTLLGLPNQPSLAGEIEKVAQVLLWEPNVERECQKIWENLPSTEKAILFTAANGNAPDGSVAESLRQRGLFHATDKALFSPIFTVFVRAQAVVPPSDTYISRSPQVVQIGGTIVTGVSGFEFELLCYLYDHRGQVCKKDDLCKHIYQQEPSLVEYNRLEKMISRLRERLSVDCVRTVRGEGYCFFMPQDD